MNQWQGIEAHDIYKDKLTGCCQEGQVHHTLSERMSTDAKVWSENGIDEMSQLRAFTLSFVFRSINSYLLLFKGIIKRY